MAIRSANELFLDELKDIYSAERQAIRSYPRLAKAIRSSDLKAAVQEHLEQTKQQVERLDRVFEILEKRSGGKTCEGMKGLLEEGAEHIEEIEQGPLLDAALIAALQRVEHYEMAAYGTVVALAEAMGQTEIQQLLAQTLQEEKDTDEKLTEVSRSVNAEAIEGDQEEEDDEEETGEEEEEASEPAKPAPKKAAKKSAEKSSRK